jgi:hypothetical protein
LSKQGDAARRLLLSLESPLSMRPRLLLLLLRPLLVLMLLLLSTRPRLMLLLRPPLVLMLLLLSMQSTLPKRTLRRPQMQRSTLSTGVGSRPPFRWMFNEKKLFFCCCGNELLGAVVGGGAGDFRCPLRNP